MGFFDLFRRKKLSDVLNRTYPVRVHGVLFELRKLNPIDFMTGAKTLTQSFDIYKTSAETKQLDTLVAQTSKMKEHYADVFLSAVVTPKLVRKHEDSGQGIWVENLFSDFDLANELYARIMEVTYGKKKMKLFTSHGIAS